jgi:aminopeptidase
MSESDLSFDPELSEGARNAIRVCLRIAPDEHVAVVADEATREIAASLIQEIKDVGASYRLWLLEELAPRPIKDMPPQVLEDLELSQVSILAVWPQPHELRSRMQFTEVVRRRKIRHAHMVNIDKRIMKEGMRADYCEVEAISRRVLDAVSSAQAIRARTAAGTDLTAEMNRDYRWLKTSGIIDSDTWGNLPGGEVFTTPGQVDGTLVVNGVVGDYLCARFGDLRENPLILRIKGNRLVEAHSQNRELEDEFWQYTHTAENGDRAGELAIGTNIAVTHVIGNILQDEKIPGLHIAFGNPYGEYTGADWTAPTHIDVVGTGFDIWADDQPIMREGRFLL